MEGALGIIEIQGLATAIAVADAMAKTASVDLVGVEPTKGGGWMTVKIRGNVAAVRASVNAGKQLGELYGGYISSKLIPRPAAEVSRLFCPTREDAEEARDAETVAVTEEARDAETVAETQTVPPEREAAADLPLPQATEAEAEETRDAETEAEARTADAAAPAAKMGPGPKKAPKKSRDKG
jgi:microcompartment protein CcmL/EutN